MGRKDLMREMPFGPTRPDPREKEPIDPRGPPPGYHDADADDDDDERGDPRSDPTERVSALAPRARRIGIDDDDDTSPVDERGDPRSDPTEEASFDHRVPRPGIDDDDDTSSATDDRGDLRSAMFNPHAPRIPIAMAPQQGFVINAGVELPRMIVPRPNVDPLAALRGPQEGQSEEERRDAYAKMMEQFQLEGSKSPKEKKSYWSGETGPVTREDFNEYKEWAEDQIRKANGITLEAASVQWHQARELEKEKMLRQEAEKKAASRQVVSPEELSGWVRANRGELRVPTFKNEDDEEERNAERGQFLYENHSYRIKELTITVLLLRARVAVERRQSTKAQHFAFEAQKLALYFDFPPLESRCLFWKGRAEARFGFLDNALDAFRKALPCEGIYREGKEVRKWIQRAAEAVQRSPVSPMTAQPLKTRSKRISFFGPGENPPEFEPEEDDSDDGEDNDETENNDPVGGDQDQGEIDRTTQNIELAPIPDMPADNTPAARRVSIAEKGKEKLSKDDSGKKGKDISQNF